jgi:hypothetical protein
MLAQMVNRLVLQPNKHRWNAIAGTQVFDMGGFCPALGDGLSYFPAARSGHNGQSHRWKDSIA